MPFLTQGKTNWKFLLIVVVLAAIVGGGTIWLVKEQEAQFAKLPEIKVPEKVKDETADWQIYKNEEWGLEMKYPTDWNLSDLSEIEDFRCVVLKSPDYKVKSAEKITFVEIEKGASITIDVSYNPNKLSPREWLEWEKSADYTDTDYYIYTDLSVIDNQPALQHRTNGRNSLIITRVSKDSYIYTILMGSSMEEEESMREVLNQILSTFRFLE